MIYQPPGPVAAKFMASRKPVIAIMGPIGSGKTSLNFMTHITIAHEQPPSQGVSDPKGIGRGVRQYKLTTIRDTYRQLWDTTIPSWWEWMPREKGKWLGADGEPAEHLIYLPRDDNTVVEFNIDFVAMGEHKVEDVLRGKQSTSFYGNEADKLAIEVIQFARGRAGRFPRMVNAAPKYYGMTLDFNAPEVESDLYKMLFEDPSPEFDVFIQPDGLSPEAENVQNLPPGYYERQMSGQPDWYIRRMIRNQFGYSRDGKPVYEEFNDHRHVAKTNLKAIASAKLIVGLDAGGNPAAGIWQRWPNGQWIKLAELYLGSGVGPNRFGENLAKLLASQFPDHREEEDVALFADPSAMYGADKVAGDDNWCEIVGKKLGRRWKIRAAPTNKSIPRLESFRGPLTRTIDGTAPGLVMDPRCRMTRRAMNSGYRYRKLNIPGDARFTEEPEKNQFSHLIEADQYALLGGGEYAEVMLRETRRNPAKRATHAITEAYENGGDRPPPRRSAHDRPQSY